MGQENDEVLELRTKLQRVEDAYESISAKASQSLNRVVTMEDGPNYINSVGREAAYFKGVHASMLALAQALGYDADEGLS